MKSIKCNACIFIIIYWYIIFYPNNADALIEIIYIISSYNWTIKQNYANKIEVEPKWILFQNYMISTNWTNMIESFYSLCDMPIETLTIFYGHLHDNSIVILVICIFECVLFFFSFACIMNELLDLRSKFTQTLAMKPLLILLNSFWSIWHQ